MIEPDSDVDDNSIRKGLLYETLCWTIWYANSRAYESHDRVWESVLCDVLTEKWKDYP